MQSYSLILAAFGAVVLLTAWMPVLLKRLPLSLPIVCIGIGVLLVWFPVFPIVWLNPLENRYLTERLTEFVVIVALMGAGLKLDRPMSWRGWETSWRLLGIAMPLTIAAITLLGWQILGLSFACRASAGCRAGADRSCSGQRCPSRPTAIRQGGRGTLCSHLRGGPQRWRGLSVRLSGYRHCIIECLRTAVLQ